MAIKKRKRCKTCNNFIFNKKANAVYCIECAKILEKMRWHGEDAKRWIKEHIRQ